MKEFPPVKKNNVVLFFVENSTGYVLNTEFQYSINDEQEVYTVFETFELAKEFVTNVFKKRNNIEAVIYDNNQNVIFTDSSEN